MEPETLQETSQKTEETQPDSLVLPDGVSVAVPTENAPAKVNGELAPSLILKKKKKKKKKKNPGAATQPGTWKLPDYTVPDLFPDGHYPVGQVELYRDDNLWRSTSAEKREVISCSSWADRF